MPKLHKKKTSIEIREENLDFKDRELWISALKKSPRPKLIFRQCKFEALALSRLLLELRKYEEIEFIDCSVLSVDLNNSMQLLLAKIANMPRQDKPIKFTVRDSDAKHGYDLDTLPWDLLFDSLEGRNSSLLLDIKDLEGNPFLLQINRDESGELITEKESAISLFNSTFLFALMGERESAKGLVVPLFDDVSLGVSFSEKEEKLIVKQARPFKEIGEIDAIEKSTLINSRIIFDYLIQVAKFAKSQNLSLEINTKLDSFNEFVYIYDAKSGIGNCNASLHSNYCTDNSVPEAIVADNLPKLLSSLPRVTRLELLNLNSRLLNEVEFADALSTSAFERLASMEIVGNAENQESKARFFTSLKRLKHLQELELLGQVLFETDMAAIAYLLMRKEKLQNVTLSGANLTDRALERLARELEKQAKKIKLKKSKKKNKKRQSGEKKTRLNILINQKMKKRLNKLKNQGKTNSLNNLKN